MEVIGFVFGLIGTIAAVYGLFSKTDKILIEIRNVLIQIRDQRHR